MGPISAEWHWAAVKRRACEPIMLGHKARVSNLTAEVSARPASLFSAITRREDQRGRWRLP
jgi:hypothetical protein